MLKSLPDTVKELQAVRLATLLKKHPRSGQKQPPDRNFAKFTGRHLCQRLFFNKFAGARRHKCFPVIFAKFLRIPFSQNTSGGLLLSGVSEPAVFRSSTKQVFLNNPQNS